MSGLEYYRVRARISLEVSGLDGKTVISLGGERQVEGSSVEGLASLVNRSVHEVAETLKPMVIAAHESEVQRLQ